jgi:hypothetical protein
MAQLGPLFAFAQRDPGLERNPAKDLAQMGRKHAREKRGTKLQIGVDIPHDRRGAPAQRGIDQRKRLRRPQWPPENQLHYHGLPPAL